MAIYKVKKGQNLFDVAITLYGSVEGLIDLLVCNRDISLDTRLKSGMELKYTEGLKVNSDIPVWFENNNVTVRNGDRPLEPFDTEEFIKSHFETHHPEKVECLETLSIDEQNIFWEDLCTPRMMARQTGSWCTMSASLKGETHMIIDWGDYSAPDIIEGDSLAAIEHAYKSKGEHIIRFFGDFCFNVLDLSTMEVDYYPLDTIEADIFVPGNEDQRQNRLIISK